MKAPVQGYLGDAKLRPGRCKAMFAELSDYLDDDLDEGVAVLRMLPVDGAPRQVRLGGIVVGSYQYPCCC